MELANLGYLQHGQINSFQKNDIPAVFSTPKGAAGGLVKIRQERGKKKKATEKGFPEKKNHFCCIAFFS